MSQHIYLAEKKQMEKICEFCASLRPIVFCKADSAFLCLSCDAKVHSANALSNRHFRCLVCESCRDQPAYVRCLDHRMLMCRACDVTLHQNTSKLNQHQKRMVGSFTGSPSAKQFAILWGFDTNELGLQEHLARPSTSSISAGSVVSTDFSGLSEQNKVKGKDEQQSSLIMQQILDLNRLQLNETNNPSSSSSSAIRECVYNTLGRIEECLEDAKKRDSIGLSDDLTALQGSHFLPSLLSHSEYLSSYTSTAGISLVGDPFWQSKTSLESNQFWPQNMEEPRVSEMLDGFDDFKMPEVDMTFPNFEDLFKGDQDLSRALLEDDSNAFLSSEKDPQFTQATGNSAASSMLMDQTNHEERQTAFPYQDYQKLNNNESTTIMMRPSYPYSYSFSHLNAESSGSDCHDSVHSSDDLARTDPSFNPLSALHGRFKDKKKPRLNTKKAQLSPRKSKAEPNRRSKGRFARPEEEKKNTFLNKTLALSLHLAAPLPSFHLSISTAPDLHLLYSPTLGSSSSGLEKAWIFRCLLRLALISFDLHQQKGCDRKGINSFSKNGRGEESTVEHASQSSEKGVEVEQPRKSPVPKRSPEPKKSLFL
ncbi:hypothetical protein V2J09_012788 [Rumex salicifolius]